MEAAKRGQTALDAGDCAEAIKQYTNALKSLPRAVDYYLKRAAAHQRSSPPDYQAALQDAEIGTHLAYERAKRELIGQAHMRRATIYFNMGEYANAGHVLEFVKKFDKGNKTIPIWESKIATALKGLAEGDEKAKVTTTEQPKVTLPEDEAKAKEKAPVKTATTAVSEAAKAPAQTPPSQVKHDWYQSKDSVTISLMAKGVPKDKATIEIEEQSVSISYPTLTGSDYTFTLDPLFAAIDPSTSTSQIKATKVELTLMKKERGRTWKSLEGTASSEASDLASNNGPTQSLPTRAPAYPTSSKNGPKDWDKLVDNMSKKPSKKSGDNSGDEDEGAGVGGHDEFDDDDMGGDEASNFFKKLYKSGGADMQRAMMKSYVESNGTVLSTNWDEVGQKKVETSPPDGMEAKKWSP